MTYDITKTNNNLSPESLYPGCSNNESTRTEVHPVLRSAVFPGDRFRRQGRLPPRRLHQRLEWLAPYGASALFAAGGTGEFFSLAASEYSQVIKTAVDTCARPACRFWPAPAARPARPSSTPRKPNAWAPRLAAAAALPDRSQPRRRWWPTLRQVCKSVEFGVVVYNRNVCRLTADRRWKAWPSAART